MKNNLKKANNKNKREMKRVTRQVQRNNGTIECKINKMRREGQEGIFHRFVDIFSPTNHCVLCLSLLPLLSCKFCWSHFFFFFLLPFTAKSSNFSEMKWNQQDLFFHLSSVFVIPFLFISKLFFSLLLLRFVLSTPIFMTFLYSITNSLTTYYNN